MKTEYRANQALQDQSAREQAMREWGGRQGRWPSEPITDDEQRVFRWVALTIAAFWAALFIIAAGVA